MNRRTVLTIGLSAATLFAFGVSAAATIDMAREAGMRGVVQPALVGVLELLSLGCAWGWVTTDDLKLKREFAVIMGVASAVSAVAGVMAFGLVGLVAPAALIAAVHVTSRMWTTPDRPADLARVDQAHDGEVEPPVEASDLVDDAADQTEVIEPDQPTEPQPALERVVSTPATTDWTDEAILADLARRGETTPTQRHIRTHYGVGPTKAKRVLEALPRPALEVA